MRAARDDAAIHFDRHPAFAQALRVEQVDEGAAGGELARLAIDEDSHGRIFACFGSRRWLRRCDL